MESRVWRRFTVDLVLPVAAGISGRLPTSSRLSLGTRDVAGACATMLKALFDEDMVIPNCVVPTKDGRALIPIRSALTVKAEVEKLAFNVAFGRNFAGIHWRSDAIGGIRLEKRSPSRSLRIW